MTSTEDLLLNTAFDYENVSVDDLSFGDDYTKVDIHKIADIYVRDQSKKVDTIKKYNQLKLFSGYIYIVGGLTLSIENAKIKSLRLRDQYILRKNLKTGKEVKLEFGKPDKELTDAIMWAAGCVINTKVFVYKKLKLYLHIDPETDNLIEIRFGDIDEKEYDF